MKTLQPNFDEAQKFLKCLDPTSDVFTFQTFDDNKDRKDQSLARVVHGTLAGHFASLVELQRRGAGVFVMVNQGDGVVRKGSKTCRTKASVISVRALFIDLDGAPLEPVLAGTRPDIVVESSPGKWHAYWLTQDCDLKDFADLQKKLALKFQGDPSVHDLPRVMRLPGFFHLKEAPFMTHLVQTEEAS